MLEIKEDWLNKLLSKNLPESATQEKIKSIESEVLKILG